jgi:iron(III) transport system ATP-binding protein
VAVLREGTIVQTAPPDVVYRSPADLDVARFVGDAVVVSGDARVGVVSCALGDLELLDHAVSGPVEVMVRPEQLRLNAHGALTATVLALTFYGPETVVMLAIDGTPEPITARVLGRAAPAVGARVGVEVDGPAIAYPSDQVGAPVRDDVTTGLR